MSSPHGQTDHTLRLNLSLWYVQLTEEIGKLEDKVECANNALKADWERWKQNMQDDLRSAFTDTAEENIRYYEQVSLWFSEALPGSVASSWLSTCPVEIVRKGGRSHSLLGDSILGSFPLY